MGFLIWLINLLFGSYILAIFARVFLSLMQFDAYHPVMRFLYRITEPLLAPLRSRIPPIGMIDVSPMAALLILWILERLIITLLVRL
jgi:YggT family protein